jgi:predicted nucleotidyltransferase
MTVSSLENIQSLPLAIQAPVSQFALKLLENSSGPIKTIVLYGSAAGVNYKQGVSNINIAVIFEKLDFALLRQIMVLVKKFRRDRIAVPLLLTKEYVLNSLDVFPIEFSEIKEQHKIIFGEDFFLGLDIPLVDVKLLCEQQIKGKLLHLRQAYLNIGSNPSLLKNFVSGTFSDLIPVFRRLLHLKGQVPCEKEEDMLRQLAKIFSLDAQPLLEVYHDKHRKILISSAKVEDHFRNFLDQLEVLARHMDSL